MSRREIISIVIITALVVSTLVVLYMYIDAKHRYESILEYVKREKIRRYRLFLDNIASALYAIQSGLNYYYKHNDTCRAEVAKTYLAYGANLIDASANSIRHVTDNSIGLTKITELHDTVRLFAHRLRSRYLRDLNSTMNILQRHNNTIQRIIDDLNKLNAMLRGYYYGINIDELEWTTTMDRVLSYFKEIISDLEAL